MQTLYQGLNLISKSCSPSSSTENPTLTQTPTFLSGAAVGSMDLRTMFQHAVTMAPVPSLGAQLLQPALSTASSTTASTYPDSTASEASAASTTMVEEADLELTPMGLQFAPK